LIPHEPSLLAGGELNVVKLVTNVRLQIPGSSAIASIQNRTIPNYPASSVIDERNGYQVVRRVRRFSVPGLSAILGVPNSAAASD